MGHSRWDIGAQLYTVGVRVIMWRKVDIWQSKVSGNFFCLTVQFQCHQAAHSPRPNATTSLNVPYKLSVIQVSV